LAKKQEISRLLEEALKAYYSGGGSDKAERQTNSASMVGTSLTTTVSGLLADIERKLESSQQSAADHQQQLNNVGTSQHNALMQMAAVNTSMAGGVGSQTVAVSTAASQLLQQLNPMDSYFLS